MIDAGSYMTAIAVYLCCAVLLAGLLARWWAFRGRAWRIFVWCLLTALALTPAPVEQASLAPAIIVGGFQVLTEGWETAAESLAWLTIAVLLALILAFLLTIMRGRRQRDAKSGETN